MGRSILGIIMLVAVVGWSINLINTIGDWVSLTQSSDMTGQLVIQTIGIFIVPVGAILGLFF